MRLAVAAALLAASAAAPARTAEIPGAVLVLEAAPSAPGSDSSGAPPRFVLLKDGQVFVGGSSLVEAGRLEKKQARELQKRAKELRKLRGIEAPLSLGASAEPRLRLRVLEDDPLEIVASGDPAQAPTSLARLATLLSELAEFHHPSLRPYAPSGYALTVREARLAGGCRGWSFPFPIAEAVASPRSVPAAQAEGWPTGAMPASVCVGPKRYAVTLRPLLPGEAP